MKHFFNADNFFWKCFDKLADVLILSLLWFICSLPVVTVGAASTALYDAAVHTVRRNEPDLFRRFFRTFRREFKTATLAWLVWGTAMFLTAAGYNMLATAAQGSGPLLAAAMFYYVLMVFPAGMLCWLFSLLSRYEFGFVGLNRTAVQFWLRYLPSTAAMAVLLALGVGLTLQLLFPVCFAPCLVALGHSFFAERCFSRNTQKEDGLPPEEPGTDDGGAA